MVDLTVVPLTFSKWRFYRENNPFINGGFSSKPIRNVDLMGFNGDSMGYMMVYPLVNIHSLLLKMAIEIVDLPINSKVIFQSFHYVYQRVDDLSGSVLA